MTVKPNTQYRGLYIKLNKKEDHVEISFFSSVSLPLWQGQQLELLHVRTGHLESAVSFQASHVSTLYVAGITL